MLAVTNMTVKTTSAPTPRFCSLIERPITMYAAQQAPKISASAAIAK